MQLTFTKSQGLFEKKIKQLKSQRDAFMNKVRIVRQYIEGSEELVVDNEKLKNFKKLCDSLMFESTSEPVNQQQTEADIKQLSELNTQSRQSYDFLAQLVQTDNNNKKTYGEQRWNSQNFV